jgi:hypothetical protein
MKLITLNLVWAVALAGSLIACNSGPPITNEKPATGGSTGTGGSGGSGGLGEGACTTEENQAVYAELVYINSAGTEFTGDEAASEMGSDCIFGSETSQPPLNGCGAEAGVVIGCFPNCSADVIQEAADCVARCVQEATQEAAPPGLSDECVACTGDTVACGAAFCTNLCVSDTNAPACIDCRCENNCIQEFDRCSGLPSGGECN